MGCPMGGMMGQGGMCPGMMQDEMGHGMMHGGMMGHGICMRIIH
jgi:hypothetical protein